LGAWYENNKIKGKWLTDLRTFKWNLTGTYLANPNWLFGSELIVDPAKQKLETYNTGLVW